MNERKLVYREYLSSTKWAEIKKTMPGPRICVACDTSKELDLHHMYYPADIYTTRHCHCCWLCRNCHEAFHRRIPAVLPLPPETWAYLRKQTKKIVQKALRKVPLKAPAPPKAKGALAVAPIKGWHVAH